MPGPAIRISTDNGGLRSMGSTSAQFLSDGHTIVYAVNGGSGFGADLYTFKARELLSGQLTNISTSPFVGEVSNFAISRDGKTAAFTTDFTNGRLDYNFFTQNISTGVVTKVASDTESNVATNSRTFSPDGTKVVFSSGQSDLVAGDVNGVIDIFVKDLATGKVSLVSTASDGSQSLAGSNRAFFTADSTKIVFSSTAGNLVAGDTNGQSDVFIKDLSTGVTTLVANTTGYQASAISADGSKILLENPLTTFPSLYSLDTKTSLLTTLSTPSGPRTFGSIYEPSYSPDGSKVIFNERVTNGLSISTEQVVISDLATGIREVVANGGARGGVFSNDGTRVAFTSDLPLVESDGNYRSDVYLRDLFNPVFGQQVTDTSGNAGKVYALYQGLLGRAPDSLGYEINTAAANAGFSLRDMAASFLASPEGQTRSGAVTDIQFVTQLYQTTLGREPDQAGLNIYVGFLKAGGARAEVALTFSQSTEFLNTLQVQFAQGVVVTDAHAAQAARLYYGIFDRAPDAGGLQNWSSYLKNGGSITDAANAFLSSAESKASGSADNATYVKSLYVNALDRPAEAAGLQGWVDYLNSGGTRGAVAVAIAESTEAQVHLVGVIENGFFLSA